ncbi:hypothetical protein Y032_0651g1147 [Ancylostoma ceylanicum]|uniref:Uncharacterized protein n=1 Tax=Ancylostoma ceylanicum TaxID=53326 RepID=A0A016WKN4_9BILA|nr:hypothetical protein Y032_0651g1147 [Ancylostoma ceylanicum]
MPPEMLLQRLSHRRNFTSRVHIVNNEEENVDDRTRQASTMRLLSVSTSKQPSFSRNAGIPPQETDPTLYYMYLRGSISHHSPVTLAGCSS